MNHKEMIDVSVAAITKYRVANAKPNIKEEVQIVMNILHKAVESSINPRAPLEMNPRYVLGILKDRDMG